MKYEQKLLASVILHIRQVNVSEDYLPKRSSSKKAKTRGQAIRHSMLTCDHASSLFCAAPYRTRGLINMAAVGAEKDHMARLILDILRLFCQVLWLFCRPARSTTTTAREGCFGCRPAGRFSLKSLSAPPCCVLCLILIY